ncbi:hypothetical protein [Nitrobacter winogradskyi]|uniref:Uncharacterized protein n=2 Tax=Nitrobacter winogradskyi TaxID=913 RepID=A0A4Y3WDZ9_NITWI|nr:hypothetical protein [Nitrobacter winogradskyi]MCP1999639.1 hypothetical protein [Nitrobacter winogradskyi]GEC17114.1 hypothetical protein NWI01_30060 [Nitrobacter winogradskyi]
MPAYFSPAGFGPRYTDLAATAAPLGTAILTLGVGLIAQHDESRDLIARAIAQG